MNLPRHFLLACLLSSSLYSLESEWIGYRGTNFTGVFPKSITPVDCDMATGRNIRWKAPMPNWGHGCPVVVKDRIFTLSEPGWKSDWPVLTCTDDKTGKILWEKEVNHLPSLKLEKAKEDEIAKAWHDFHATWRDLYLAFNLATAQKKTEEGQAKFDALGYTFGGHKGGGYGQLRSLGIKAGSPGLAKKLDIKEAGLHGETWHHGCGLGTDCIGMAYASPVTDGKSIFVLTTYSAASCYDLEGNLRWQTFVKPTKTTETYARSPLLYQDLLITDHFGCVVALDKTTGVIRWKAETKGNSIATPAVITVAGTDILLSEGPVEGGFGLYAVRLSDGKILPVQGWSVGGTQILTDTDRRDVAYFCGRGQHSFWPEKEGSVPPPTAVRFSLEGENLKAIKLWDGKNFVGAGGFTNMVYHAGKLYASSVIIDAATGAIVKGEMGGKGNRDPKTRPLPQTRHLMLIAGDKIYGLDGEHRTCDGNFKTFATLECFSLDGKFLGKSTLTAAPVQGEKLTQTRSQVGWDFWPFAYGFPFTISGDRIYVRGFDELICIGEK